MLRLGLRLQTTPLAKRFERHLANEFGVLGQVHFTHATGAELFDDLVVMNLCANHG